MEIVGICRGRTARLSGLREIRVRREGRCSVLYENEYIPLTTSVLGEEMEEMLYALCRGSLYAFRDNISEGFIPLSMGVRVGVCGAARYEGGGIVGISEAASFVFRIPGHKCAFGEELYALWRSEGCASMLIYSPPGGGKTTALRELARRIGSGRDARRVAVVDERCEFCAEDFRGAEVDILSGYKRCEGIEIAARTLSPEVLLVDELGDGESDEILGLIACGVPVIATAHAGSRAELYAKPLVVRLSESCAFETFIGISKTEDGYCLSVEKGEGVGSCV